MVCRSVADVVRGMQSKARRALVQEKGCAVLAELATDTAQAVAAVQHGAVGVVAVALRNFPSVLMLACTFVVNLVRSVQVRGRDSCLQS